MVIVVRSGTAPVLRSTPASPRCQRRSEWPVMTRAGEHGMLEPFYAFFPWPMTTDSAQMEDPFGLLFESVSELTARIKQSLKAQFGEVALRGEVSNVARPKSGHVYFTLRD